MSHLIKQNDDDSFFFPGGLFLHANTVPTSFITLIPSSSSSSNSATVSCFSWNIGKRVGGDVFSSLSLSIKERSEDADHSQRYTPQSNEDKDKKVEEGVVCEENEIIRVHGSGAVNMTKHLWSGAFAAMVSRSSSLLS